MPKTAEVVVATLDGDQTYEITSKTTGADFFRMVCERNNLGELSFFNLQYIDAKDYEAFVKPDKKVLSHDLKKIGKEEKHHFSFLAQYFPEMVADELQHPIAQEYLWKQIRKEIIADTCYCPPELCVLFAAQSMQAIHGDLIEDTPAMIIAENELPQRVLGQHDLTPQQWADRIRNAWATLKGTAKETVIQDYLSIAQDLEQYGVTYFEIHNKKGTKLWLGVHNLGMDIYEFHNKVTPRLGFPWTEIRNISFNDKKFTIKMVDSKAPDFKFFSPRFKLNKRILALCVGNHQMYVERRRKQMAGEGVFEDRATVEAKIRKTKDQLLAIRADLESVKDTSKTTNEDKIHQEAEAAGMDRYKTMKKAQSGDADKRIQMFEELEDAEC
eukprot:TRINITY_DN12458_c1_g4_i2.p1 TRINITY_DN12458_c1_g4~~TRINITY_DN12458_c1_g4_i2.p1  ORF type:complete len:384 (+),score=108.75 TRINITY_DN12458_c1_g4_i2:74-1225(+)